MPFYKRLTRLLSGTPQEEKKPRRPQTARSKETLSKDDVRHLARQAQLRLSEAEEEQLAEELSGLLEYTGKLSEVDTAGVPPMTHGLDLAGNERPDEAQTRLSREDALACAPEADGEYFRAPGASE